jgi:hypothetical protein
MKNQQPGSRSAWLATVFVFAALGRLQAQQPIGRTAATEIQVSGAVNIAHGETVLGNGSNVTAGDQAIPITLQRGGSLRLCSTSSVYLARDGSVDDQTSNALMMALGRGAMEAAYTVGKYSDVVMTPDLRILVSGPGVASLSIRVNTQGDTCVDNHGSDAPYVTVSSQFEGGAYRVMPNQRVSFQHGSLLEVVDHEPEPCGCPSVPATELAQGQGQGNAEPAKPAGGPSSTAADTAFPIAQSEGLAPPPKPPDTPVVPAGQAHAQVTVPLVYSGEAPPASPAAQPAAPPSPAPVAPTPPAAHVSPSPEPAPAPAVPLVSRPAGGGNVFRSIGHFFAKIFGK